MNFSSTDFLSTFVPCFRRHRREKRSACRRRVEMELQNDGHRRRNGCSLDSAAALRGASR